MIGWDRQTAAQPLLINSIKKDHAQPSKNTSVKEILKSPLSSLANNKINDIEKLNKELEDKLVWSEIFDDMMECCLKSPQYIAFESHMTLFFHSNRAIFWEKRPNSSAYFSRTLKTEVSSSCSLIQPIISTSKPIIPDLIYDPDLISTFSLQSFDHQFFVPLKYPDGTICAIIQLSRHQNCSPFGDEEFKIAEFVMKKFIIYGSSFFQKERIVSLASKVSQIGPLSQTAIQIKKTLQTSFQCNSPDIWFLQLNDGGYFRFDDHIKEFIGVYKCSTGVVGFALRNDNVTINSSKVGDLKHFSSSVDGDMNDPILMCSYEFEGRIWCVALRGQRTIGNYTNDDQNRLSTIIPFIARSLSFSGGFLRQNLNSEKKSEISRIKMIGTASSIVDSFDIQEIIKLAQTKTADALKAEFCRVLIVDSNKRELKGDFGCKPLNCGFAGSSVLTKQSIICANPEEDSRFDREVDVNQSCKVRNILTVPVVDDHDAVSSVFVVLNKVEGEFNESDKMKLTTLSKFFGIAFKNSECYRSSLLIFSQLKDFVNSSYESIEKVLNKIKDTVRASSVMLFIYVSSSSSLQEFATIGEKIENGIQYATVSLESKKTSFFSFVQKQNKSIIICVPFFDNDDTFLGVTEFCCDSSEFNDELSLLESFVALASSSLNKSYLKGKIEFEEEKLQFKRVVGDENLDDYETPNSLLTAIESDQLFDASFIVQGNSEDELMKIVFSCFDQFKLKQELKIKSQQLFSFIVNLSKTYNDVPYHNWPHAVSTCLFTAVLLMKSKLDETFNKLEILSVLIASLGHDSGHDCFLRKRNEIPFSILYKNQSVNEMNHCAQLINVLSKESSNLLSSIDENSMNSIFELIIYLILSTNISKHFYIINEYDKINKNGSFSLEKSDHRKLQLALFLKCADFSECLKKFDFADILKNFISDEFFRLGSIEKVDGMEYINDDHKRSSLDKENSLIGFFKFVTFPLFEVVCKYKSDLQFVKENFDSNFHKWRENDTKRRGIDIDKDDESDNQESVAKSNIQNDD